MSEIKYIISTYVLQYSYQSYRLGKSKYIKKADPFRLVNNPAMTRDFELQLFEIRVGIDPVSVKTLDLVQLDHIN